MPLFPYALARPFLFALDAERTHDLVMHWLGKTQHTLWSRLYQQRRIEDPVQIGGLTFPNRVGLAAGLDKNARCIDALASFGFGFIEVGTVTPKAQSGNPKPRLFRLTPDQALINRLGFNNDGLEAFLANIQKQKARPPANTCLLGLNIGKNATTPIEQAAADYEIGLRGVYPYADYVAINISSPNTQHLRSLQSDEALHALLHRLAQTRQALQAQHHKHVPLFVKIAPDLDEAQIEVIAKTLVQTGMDGVIATNTTLDRATVAGHPLAWEAGGLSGAPLLLRNNRVIQTLRAALTRAQPHKHFPIIGVGGISSESDALAKIHAGADLVQLYTGLIYQGPSLVPRIAKALRQAGGYAG